MSSDGVDLDAGLRAAANGVLQSSASVPGSDRFRQALRMQCASAGYQLDDDTLAAIDDAMARGDFSRF